MDKYDWWILKQKTHNEILDIFRNESIERPWCGFFLNDSPYFPGNLNSKCRIGNVPFDKCIQDRFYYIDKSRKPEILAAGAITTQFFWNFEHSSLPNGWQGAVKQSFNDSQKKIESNTQVALLAFTTQRYRKRGLSSLILSKMIEMTRENNYKYLLVPALPPSQFEKEYMGLSMEELSYLKRDDGQYYDYWVRLHSRKGAKIIGFSDSSHRFIYDLSDFRKYVSSAKINTTGEHVVCLDRDIILNPKNTPMWQKIHVDVERDLVSFDWGCIWVKYDCFV